jgi:glycosyltransferase involved in cell wall biosynthesis
MEPTAGVCLIMPFLNEARHLPGVLASLTAQTYPHDRISLIAIDNGSSDGSAEIVTNWLGGSDIRGEVRRLAEPSIPRALNAAIARVRPDSYVVRVDAHTRYAPDYVADVMDAFAALPQSAWCVGGSPDVVAPYGFGTQLHAALFNNPMGLGPAAYRSSARTGPVASVYLGAWRPGVLQRVGGYDERWRANEDAELAQRIQAAGGDVIRIPVRSEKIITRGAGSALRQWSRYGYWRAQTIVRHPRSLRWRHLAPPAAIVVTVILAASRGRKILPLLYVAFAIMTVRSRPRDETPAVTAASLIYFPVVHAGFGGGMLVGLAAAAGRALRARSGSS